MSFFSVARVLTAIGVSVAGISLGLSASASSAAAPPPTARLIAVLHQGTVDRFAGDNELFITPGVYVASVGGAFEIDAYANSDGSVTLWHVKRTASGVTKLRQITAPSAVSIGDGLPDFLQFTLATAKGKTISAQTQPFCPGGFYSEARVDRTGPDRPTYPWQCGSSLTQATAWGIDNGWGAGVFAGMRFPKYLADGTYQLTVAINPAYASQLRISAGNASATVSLAVTTVQDCNPEVVCGPPTAAQLKQMTAQRRVPLGAESAQATLSGIPDMRALPAHDLSTEHNADDGHDYLDFGATIWNGGTGPLDVEGFRESDSDTMQAVQYIYADGQPDGGQVVGTFEFDTRPGHNHWHMEDIAQYDLLDSSGRRAVLSEKQSFCLAPTDPINMLSRGADWGASAADLSSSCQGEDAIWLREALPAGWGDTYYQDRAGQSFDITDLPNGNYRVRVVTDPNHTLVETSYTNNIGLLDVTLGGTKGHRTVTTG